MPQQLLQLTGLFPGSFAESQHPQQHIVKVRVQAKVLGFGLGFREIGVLFVKHELSELCFHGSAPLWLQGLRHTKVQENT